MEQVKLCKGCKTVKPWSEYHPDATALKKGDWRPRYQCKDCTNAKSRAWHHRQDPTVAKRDSKNRHLKHKYGITLEQFEQRLAEQGGLCAICGCSEETEYHPFGVDHDHACCPGIVSCGKCVRGIICNLCNRTLGMVNDDIERLEKLVQYLLAWDGMPSRRQQSMQG